MGIEQELNTKLKLAMRAGQKAEVSVIRMVKTQADKERTSAGFDGETDDVFWLGVIGAYVKQQKKALVEYEKLGDAGADHLVGIKFEIEFLTPYLPTLKSEEETSVIVEQVIAQTGAAGPKMIGRVIGAVMKDHRDEVDPALVKRIAAAKLA